MRSIQDWLDAYGESHQNPINKKIHWVCVPLIMLSLLGLLWMLKIPILNDSSYLYIGKWSIVKIPYNAATVLISIVSIYYFRLSIQMGLGMLCISFFMVYIIIYMDSFGIIPYIVIFVLSWIGQFIGHKIEGKKPSFFEDLQFLLIGPLWLLSQLYRAIGIKY